jgi:hypothetical protein
MTAKLIGETYARPALTPAMTWLDERPPASPQVALERRGPLSVVTIQPASGEPAFLWVIQSRWPEGWRTEIVPAGAREWQPGSSYGMTGAPGAVWVSAVDRLGNQSAPVRAAMAVAGRAEQAPSRAGAQEPALPPGVIPHAEWESAPRLGHAADANRRNLRAGDSLTFRDIRIGVLATKPAAAGGDADSVTLTLARDGARAERTVAEGAAFSWEGHHIAIVAVYGPGELGAGLTAVEVATLSSLPSAVAQSNVAGGAALRLRIPHRITHVTLHHTGSAEPLRPADDPVQKLRGLQSWGASDRNWWDVPYHFLIDLDGRTYEGRDWRYMGETNTTYDPAGHFLISVIGNYARQEPEPAQIEAIADLMAWAVKRFELPLDRIGGHYDYAETTCPGEHLKKFLEDGTFRRMVAQRLNRSER